MGNVKNICDEFIKGLDEKYKNSDEKLKADYNSFIEKKKGITDEELNDLKKVYPDIPESLIELLKYSNGTDIYCFQSDVDDGKYPYYLVSSKEMIDGQDEVEQYYSGDLSREETYVEVDDKLTYDTENVKWLLFSNCANNGGTSRLFIDFNPSKEGKVGQIVRYLHDPDSYIVIADSFDEFLKQIIDSNYKFIDGEMELNERFKDIPEVKIDEKKLKKLNSKWEKKLSRAKVKPESKLDHVVSLLMAIVALLMGILGVFIGIIGIVISKAYLSGIFMLLCGLLFIIFAINGLKENNK